MSKKLISILSLIILASLALVACGGDTATEAPADTGSTVTDSDTGSDAGATTTRKVCQVTDTGGIDDKSFNATAWKGAQDAEAAFGVEPKYLESQQQTDYEKNINAFIEDGCDLIVTVGFLLGDATAVAAETNPDVNFAIVDFAYDPAFDNVLGLVFATDQAAFLAGYVAAGTTQTGKVATFGGIQIPPVTVFMDGFALGVDYYNEQNGTSVEVLGWDPYAQTGLFTGNFESTDDGRALGESLMDEGADIIMPVAGPVGLGTAAAAQERGGVYIVGVDNDWTLTSPEYADILLTSVLKNMDVSVYNATEQVLTDTFAGGVFIGTVENGGVGLAPFHNMDGMVSDAVKTGLDDVRAGIISGEISTSPTGDAPAEEPAEEATQEPTEEPAEEPAAVDGTGSKVCQVTDTGGIDDKSFNATAWKGAQDAEAAFGVEPKYLESQQQTDYEKNINAFIEDGCNLIVTVGFLLGDATAVAAETNPDVNFAIVDFAYDPGFDNVLGLVFATDQAAFLAGYVAAGTTQTGKVATFGGIQIPPVTVFMDGFALGVAYYNEQNGTSVEVLGWDPIGQAGLFTGNFESTDDGRALGESLMDEGADIIMPVAGPVGLGTAAAAQERGGVYIVGVDNDWTLTSPEYSDILLTSVLKNMDVSVYNATEQVLTNTFTGGVFLGTVENGGVGLAPFHNLDGMVSDAVKAALEDVRAGIIAGSIQTTP